MKKCNKCGETKSKESFSFTNKAKGYRNALCKSCFAIYYKEYHAKHKDKISKYKTQWARDNNEKVLEQRRKLREENREKFTTYHKEYRKNNKEKLFLLNKNYRETNKERVFENGKRWREANRDRLLEEKKIYNIEHRDRLRPLKRQRERERMAVDISFRISKTFSHRLRESLKTGKNGKKWQAIVGYSVIELRAHLESQFQPGMNWDNYGKYGWHIDHRHPVSAFNFTSTDDPDFKKCWALTNLQPLWATDNMKKGARIAVNF